MQLFNSYRINEIESQPRHFLQIGNSRDGDIDAEITAVGKKLSDARVKDEAVRVVYGSGDALVDRPRGRLVGQPTPHSIQFQPGKKPELVLYFSRGKKFVFLPVSKIFCLFLRANDLNHSKKLRVPFVLFLFFEDQHEVMSEARLHHHPVYSTR
jgi:hypothetical protein